MTRDARVLVSRALAVALPGVVFGWGVAAIMTNAPAVADKELARAGQVVNGVVVGTDPGGEIDALLAASEPRVLVLGNSLANSNVDPRTLARELDLPPRRVAVITVPNSIASHWYAILANRVFDAGHRPELIVVLSPLQAMLLVEPYSEASRTSLIVHMNRAEPVLDAYVKRDPPWLERWRTHRARWRQAALDGWRDASVGMVFAGDTQEAMSRLFGDVNPEPAGFGGDGLSALRHPDQSLIGPLADLVTAHQGRLILVRPPTASHLPKRLRDPVPPGITERTADLLAERGHSFVDAVDVKLPAAAFANPRHMTDDGARQFTRLIGPDLRAAWEHARRTP